MPHGYSLGIEIHLVDHVSQQLLRMNQNMLAAQGAITDTQRALMRMQNFMGLQMPAMLAGQMMFSGAAAALHGMVEPAKEYAEQLNKMRMSGLDYLEVQGQITAAWEATRKNPIMSPTGALGALADLGIIFGRSKENLAEAQRLLPDFMKVQAIMTSVTHDSTTGQARTTQIFSAVKAIEMMGKIKNEDEFRHHLEMMTRVMVSTGGRVKPSDYQSLVKYARFSKLTMDEDMLYKVAPELIMEMQTTHGGAGGTGGPGAMINALTRMITQGGMSKVAYAKFAEYGLTRGKFESNGFTGYAQGGIVGGEVAARNQSQWVNEYLVPAILRKHPDFDKGIGPDGKRQYDEMGIAFAMADIMKGSALPLAQASELWNKRLQLEKSGRSLDRVGDMDAMMRGAMESPAVVDMMLAESWKTLMISIGKVLIPFIPALNAVSFVLQDMAKFFVENEWAATFTVILLGATAVTGAILLFAAAMVPLVAGLILGWSTAGPIIGMILAGIALLTSVGVLIAGLVKKDDWEYLKSAIEIITEDSKSLCDYLEEKVKWLTSWMKPDSAFEQETHLGGTTSQLAEGWGWMINALTNGALGGEDRVAGHTAVRGAKEHGFVFRDKNDPYIKMQDIMGTSPEGSQKPYSIEYLEMKIHTTDPEKAGKAVVRELGKLGSIFNTTGGDATGSNWMSTPHLFD